MFQPCSECEGAAGQAEAEQAPRGCAGSAAGGRNGGRPAGRELPCFSTARSESEEPAAGRLSRSPPLPCPPAAPRLAQLSSGEARPGGRSALAGLWDGGSAANREAKRLALRGRGFAAHRCGGGGQAAGPGAPCSQPPPERNPLLERELLRGGHRAAAPASLGPAQPAAPRPRPGPGSAPRGWGAQPSWPELGHRWGSSERGAAPGRRTRWVKSSRAPAGARGGIRRAARFGPRSPRGERGAGREGATRRLSVALSGDRVSPGTAAGFAVAWSGMQLARAGLF